MKKNVNNSKTFIILIVFITLGIGTYFHDPILHTIPALLFGWNVPSSFSGFTTGSTNALINPSATPLQLWIFYMLPSIAIYAVTLFLTLTHPTKLILISADILLLINLPSFDPLNKGSDSYNAMQYITLSSPIPFILHFLMFIIAGLILAIFLSIAIEDNVKDAKSRIRSL